MADAKIKPFYQTLDGLTLPRFRPERIREALNYKPTSSDVFIATYPKCGTAWMQAMALFIFRKGKELEDPTEFSKRSPFVEKKGIEGINNIIRPGAFKTHFPFTYVPYSPEAKYIYVLRNPKDCCVSMYYHTKRQPGYWEATFDDFFEIFMSGEVEYNDYFDHLDSWYPHLNDKNVFFTTYERMKEDSKDVVLKLASFLGQEYIDAIEKDSNVLNNILKFSSFDYMKNNLLDFIDDKPKNKKDHFLDDDDVPEDIRNAMKRERPKDIAGLKHLRKGVIGDWRGHFSKEQNERMNKKFLERTQGTEIQDMYMSYIQ